MKNIFKIFISLSCVCILYITGMYDVKINGIELSNKKEVTKENKQVEELYIYEVDENTYQPQVDYKIKVEATFNLKEKLNVIANELSENRFGNLPIEVVSIEDEIAVINLKENNSSEVSWSNDYFTNTHTANVTCKLLIESFLQEDYKGEWIKGARFLYNGKINLALDSTNNNLFENHYRNLNN